MKSRTFNIPIYDFKVTLVEVESKEDTKTILPILKSVHADPENIENELKYIEEGVIDGAGTYSNLDMKKFVVVLHPTSSKLMRLEILGHEKRHIEDYILQKCHIIDIEASAYLAGYLTKKLFI